MVSKVAKVDIEEYDFEAVKCKTELASPKAEKETLIIKTECELKLENDSMELADAQYQTIGNGKFFCFICNEDFKSTYELKTHQDLKHVKFTSTLQPKQESYVVEMNMFNCGYCNIMFSGTRLFKKHMKNHNELKPFVCSVCNKDFSDFRLLQGHKAVHSDNKPYNCATCNKSFKYLGNLRVHLRYHANLKSFKCEVCQKSFFIARDLRRHIRVHTGDRRYHCTSCEKSFFDAQSLKRHSLCHNRDSIYSAYLA